MRRITQGDLAFYQFETLADASGLAHGVYTRLGGRSAEPFDTLNVGATVGDDPACVRANRNLMYGAMGVSEEDVRTTWQVHGAEVIVIDGHTPQTWPPPQADGIVTQYPGIALVMRFADCVPLLFYDPVQHVIGMAHAGWRGTVVGAGPAVVKTMCEVFGCTCADIIVGIGPSIGPCCYEVGAEVVEQMGVAFGSVDNMVSPAQNGHGAHLDLWAANHHALRGVGIEQVEIARVCTACNTQEFYSHRAERGRTGRFGALIMLQESD